MPTIPRAVRQAVAKHGKENCQWAYNQNQHVGNGANTIGHMLKITTRQADAAINAGRYLAQERLAEVLGAVK